MNVHCCELLSGGRRGTPIAGGGVSEQKGERGEGMSWGGSQVLNSTSSVRSLTKPRFFLFKLINIWNFLVYLLLFLRFIHLALVRLGI